jgi:hypothetical protein
MPITAGGGNGASFQGRPVADAGSNNSDSSEVVAPPYWVKLERVGNDFTGSISADGVTWTQVGGAETLEMADPVLIGLAVTSHASGEVRTFTFDNVDIVGDVTADNASTDIDSVSGNSAEPIYVALEDAAGAVGVVAYPDPAATRIAQWWNMKIALADFADQGVDLTAAAKLYFGVGSGEGGGAGTVTVDDVMIIKAADAGDSDDVTAPGDNILGVPNDGDWPGGEYPSLAIDDDTSTKFLHFKGEIGPSGIQVEPLVGSTVVTGLALTSANDAAPRDPASYEVYGSNVSINGPYDLIASGDIVDFIGEAEWPRFTKNETAITFDNAVAYKFYQVLFPTVRDAGNANSMQIAEIELLSTPGPAIIWVTGGYDDNGDGAFDDLEWVDILEAEGYSVDNSDSYVDLDDAKIAALNAADLIIVSRNSNSGDYANGDEVAQWNAITTPIILSSTHIVRSSRWKWVDSTSIVNLAPVMELADGTSVAEMDETVGPSSFIDAVVGNGTVLATGDGLPWIFEFETGVEYYDGAGQFAGGPRMFFTAGTQEADGIIGRGEMNLTSEGLAMFLDAVSGLISGD